MADVVSFHHVLGLTDGVRDFAERLDGADLRVHTRRPLSGRIGR